MFITLPSKNVDEQRGSRKPKNARQPPLDTFRSAPPATVAKVGCLIVKKMWPTCVISFSMQEFLAPMDNLQLDLVIGDLVT